MSDNVLERERAWPSLPLAQWQETYETVHRLAQIIGKTRLRFSAPQNHWWHSALYVTTSGLGTSPMWSGSDMFEVDLDFVEHQLVIRRADGEVRNIALRSVPIRDLYAEYLSALGSLAIDCRIYPVPRELADTLRFDEDSVHRVYDGEAMHRCWQALASSDRVFKKFRGKFLGKSSPSHFWWGAFDLACTRFSGRRAPLHPGGIPNCPDYVMREAYSHECMSVGWWPGSVGGIAEPAFYAYVYPEPPGCSAAPIAPEQARYDLQMREWILPYEAVRSSSDPDDAVMQFCQSTYEAAANFGGWNRKDLEVAGSPESP